MKHQSNTILKSIISVFAFLLIIISFSTCKNEGPSKSETKEAIFTKTKTKYIYSVKDFDLPTNWENSKYLELEIKLSSPESINLSLVTDRGETGFSVRPASNGWIKLDIPLTFYKKSNTEGSEMAALYSRSRTTGWFNIWGVKVGPLTQVDSIGFDISCPTDKVKLELKSIKLTNESHEEFIDPKVMVDKFGQWIHANWNGKIKNEEELKSSWKNDEAILASLKNLDRDQYGGFNNTHQKVTGFFYTKKIDGKWWFVNPLGNLFLATGMNGVSPGDYTRTKNRSYIFEEMPPKEFQQTSDDGAPLISFGLWNQKRHFGDDWKNKWKNHAVNQLSTLGFNAINWSVPYLNDKVVYAKFMKGWGIEEGVMGMPDIYSQAFLDQVDHLAKEQCAPLKNDPYLLGYFIGNEPVWPGMESLVVDAILESDKTPEMKKVLKEYLKAGDTPERRKEFIHESFKKFLKAINSAIKKYDPNHLTLGIRFGGDLNMEDSVIKMAEIFDVFSFNAYLPKVHSEKLDKVARIMDKPVLIGEFHFGVADHGLGGGLQQVKDQDARGESYRYFVESAFSHPNVVSTFWYRWRDQPNTGRSDGENYNIGFVNVTGQVYVPMVKAAVETHKRIFDVHSGKIKPFNK